MADGGGWISKYGIPSVIASIAVFAFQQQQQTFDRLQSSVQDGYQFYSSGRTSLQYSDDADRELSQLKIIGNAFPNIYCDVREDIFERASAAQPGLAAPDPNGRAAIDSTDLAQLRQQLVAADRPARLQFPENIIQSYTQFGRGPGRACPALNQPDTSDETANTAATVASSASAPAASAPAASAPAAEEERAPSLAASSDAGPAAMAPMARAAVVASAASPPQLTANATLIRVFFHIPMAGARDPSFVEGARSDLSAYNYRVMRGVERAPPARFPDGPEVRYFDQNEEAAAQQLATYLNWQFRSENLHFTPRAMGARFPSMPRQTLEVWVPNPR